MFSTIKVQVEQLFYNLYIQSQFKIKQLKVRLIKKSFIIILFFIHWLIWRICYDHTESFIVSH